MNKKTIFKIILSIITVALIISLTTSVFAEDDERDPLIPRGKQCEKLYSCVCDYTRTTGIWQTVWLEFMPKDYISSVKYFPDVSNTSIGNL